LKDDDIERIEHITIIVREMFDLIMEVRLKDIINPLHNIDEIKGRDRENYT